MTEIEDDGPVKDPGTAEGARLSQYWERKTKRRKVQPIDAELRRIDQARIRPTAEVEAAREDGEEPDPQDVERLKELKAAAQSLRSQRREITAKLKDGDKSAARYKIEWPDWQKTDNF